MDHTSEDINARFKEIVKGLPTDKKKALYEKLKSMDAEERSRTIAAIVEKEESIKKTVPSAQNNKRPAPQNRPAQNKGKAPQKKNVPAKKQGRPEPRPQGKKSAPSGKKQAGKPAQKPVQKQAQKPAQKPVGKPVKKQAPKPVNQEKPVKKAKPEKIPEEGKKKSPARTILFIVIILMAAAVLGFTGYNNRESVMKLWRTVTGAPEPTTVETSEITAETTEPSPTPTPAPTSTPTPTPVPIAADAPDLTGLTVVLDPGHQMHTSEESETVASWMAAEKSRCTSGGEGISTGVPEYDLTLRFSVMLKEYLEGCGATVIMTRTENDVDLSNQERARMATSANCGLFLRIHADSANDSLTSGIQMYVPSQGNYYKNDIKQANTLGEALAEATGMTYNGCLSTEVYTGLNYATSVHSLQVSLGYLSNSDDEAIITNEEMQYNMVVCFAQFCAEYK